MSPVIATRGVWVFIRNDPAAIRKGPLSHMCGGFGASFQYRELKVHWNLAGDIPLFGPRYNIPPAQDVPVIVRNEKRNELRPVRWELVRSWDQDRARSFRTN
jgi:putative SOS response-associated peptidase YedK